MRLRNKLNLKYTSQGASKTCSTKNLRLITRRVSRLNLEIGLNHSRILKTCREMNLAQSSLLTKLKQVKISYMKVRHWVENPHIIIETETQPKTRDCYPIQQPKISVCYPVQQQKNSQPSTIESLQQLLERMSGDAPRGKKFNLTEYIRSRLEFEDTGKCTNAFKVLSDSVTLVYAYETIKSKSGNMVPGVDNETLDGLKKTWFSDTSDKLQKESYTPKPSRRIHIPKANGKKRPLGISSPRDKIIQQSMRIVLEMVLEPKFCPSSHGFRPSRGCHSALKSIREWKGVPWLIEGDIKSFFDDINHQILEKLLKEHFQEPRLINLYWKLVKAGYVEMIKRKTHSIINDVGVPQGGIISPLLSNLMLHSLDKWIQKKIEERIHQNEELAKIERREKANPKYTKLTREIGKLKTKLHIDPKKINMMISRLEKERRSHKRRIPNLNFVRYRYVRYADDWLIGVWGTENHAQILKSEIRVFLLDLGLTLSQEKTIITNTRKTRALFLGTHIKRLAPYGNTPQFNAHGMIVMTAPLDRLLKRLREKKFFLYKDNRITPQGLPWLQRLPIKELILWFRTIMAGLLNFYSFVDNIKKFKTIYWILKDSLMKTIQRRENIGRNELLKKYGKNVTINILRRDKELVKLDFKPPVLKRDPMNFFENSNAPDPLARKNWKISVISALGQNCANCNSSKKIEMHHVKHLKTLNVKLSPFEKMMARVNRKQVPLCTSCHDKVHAGKYNGMSLRYFKYIKWIGTPKWS